MRGAVSKAESLAFSLIRDYIILVSIKLHRLNFVNYDFLINFCEIIRIIVCDRELSSDVIQLARD